MNEYDDYYEDGCYYCMMSGDNYYVNENKILILACKECLENKRREKGNE